MEQTEPLVRVNATSAPLRSVAAFYFRFDVEMIDNGDLPPTIVLAPVLLNAMLRVQ
jgi:hypothetical protein